jgi:hypothetical protein
VLFEEIDVSVGELRAIASQPAEWGEAGCFDDA